MFSPGVLGPTSPGSSGPTRVGECPHTDVSSAPDGPTDPDSWDGDRPRAAKGRHTAWCSHADVDHRHAASPAWRVVRAADPVGTGAASGSVGVTGWGHL